MATAFLMGDLRRRRCKVLEGDLLMILDIIVVESRLLEEESLGVKWIMKWNQIEK